MRDDDFSDRRMFLDALREIAGEGAVRSLCLRHGGQHLIVPCKYPSDKSALVRLLGMETAEAIVNKFRVIDADGFVMGGFRVYIRRIDDECRAVRRKTAVYAGSIRASLANATREAAVDAVLGGMSKHDVVEAFGIKKDTLQRGIKQRLISNALTEAERSRLLCRSPHPNSRRADAFDEALIAAHAENPSAAAMASRLDIQLDTLADRVRRVRARTGLALKVSYRRRSTVGGGTEVRRDLTYA